MKDTRARPALDRQGALSGGTIAREAISYFQKVLAVAPKFGDPELMALQGAVIGHVIVLQGQFAKAHQLLDRTVPLLEATQNRHELLFACLYQGLPGSFLTMSPPEPLNSTRS